MRSWPRPWRQRHVSEITQCGSFAISYIALRHSAGMMKSLLPVPMIPREACKKIAKQQTQAKAAVPPPPPSPLSVSCNLSTRMRPRSARGRLLPGVSVEDHALAVVTKSGISVGSMPDFLTGGLSEKPGASGARRNRALSRERSKNNDRGAQVRMGECCVRMTVKRRSPGRVRAVLGVGGEESEQGRERVGRDTLS